jgi:hypothetical protein
MTLNPPHFDGLANPESDRSHLHQLVQCIERELLPQLQLHSNSTHNDPVTIDRVPTPWQKLGAGNYAAVFAHPDYLHQVVKIYAPGMPGFEEEIEVYRRLGTHPAFSECLYAGKNFLVLKRLYGTTLYDSVHQGLSIPPQVIIDIDRALDDARARGLNPSDIHGRNVMMDRGRGFVVDVSDFLQQGTCLKWRDLKRAYYWLYRPIIQPLKLRIPYPLLDVVRKSYRYYRRLL